MPPVDDKPNDEPLSDDITSPEEQAGLESAEAELEAAGGEIEEGSLADAIGKGLRGDDAPADDEPPPDPAARRALAAFPENVDIEAMQQQEDQEPLAATAEAGQAMIDSIVENVARHVQEMIDGTNQAEIPAFH